VIRFRNQLVEVWTLTTHEINHALFLNDTLNDCLLLLQTFGFPIVWDVKPNLRKMVIRIHRDVSESEVPVAPGFEMRPKC
jgi:hypothetical protein